MHWSNVTYFQNDRFCVSIQTFNKNDIQLIDTERFLDKNWNFQNEAKMCRIGTSLVGSLSDDRETPTSGAT